MFDYLNDNQYAFFRRFVEVSGVQRHEWVLLCDYGFGDTYFVCSLLEAFRDSPQFKPDQHAIVIATKEAHRGIVEGFSHVVDRIIGYQSIDREAMGRFGRFEPGTPFVIHPFQYGDGRLAKFLMKDGVSILDIYRFLLGVPFDAPPSQPMLPMPVRASARAKARELGVEPGKSVLVAPHAFSMRTMPVVFWQALIDRLNAKGYKVFLNVDPRFALSFTGATPATLAPTEVVPFSDECGWAIASRSGLCDLLIPAQAHVSILYPYLAQEADRLRIEMNAYSLRGMGARLDDLDEIGAVVDQPFEPVLEQVLARA